MKSLTSIFPAPSNPTHHRMKNILLAICIFFLMVTVSACDTVDSSEETVELVVEAFLFTDLPVDNIRITEAIPLSQVSDTDSLERPVNDAQVTLSRSGESFPLTASGTEGFYHYDGNDLTVSEGDVFQLKVQRGGTTLTATTTVPRPPESVDLSTDQVEVVRLIIGPNGPLNPGGADAVRESLLNAGITVSWSNPNAELHFVVVESIIEGQPDYILPEFILDQIRNFRLVTEPTDEDFFDVDLRSMETFGQHQATVYRVNQEYADLYESREQDSRDLNEPASNIEGGLGVFSAFAGVVEAFEVVPE